MAVKSKPHPKKLPPKVFRPTDDIADEDDHEPEAPELEPTPTGETVPAEAKAKAPVRYTAGLADRICQLIAINTPIQAICALPDMPTVNQVQYWARKMPKFEEMLEQARILQADYVADEMVMIAKELRNTTVPGRVSALKAAADLLCKQAEWRAPRKYGPKMDLTVNERPKTPDEIKAEIVRLRAELGVPEGRIARVK